ncbi:MAG: cysteine--tRNA ligase [bacterium]
MKIHNTLTKQVETIKPIDSKKLGIYSCGPTVYNRVHIGNLSSFIYADLINRVARASDYKVKHVMNFTDIDDKTIKRSSELYPNLSPEEALLKLTEAEINQFTEDARDVGIDTSKIDFIKATASIDIMQNIILELIEHEGAYVADDGVYFSIENYTKNGHVYGQLSNIDASSTSSSRINNDEYDKDNIHDFALWKFKTSNEPSWDFEINGTNYPGRPGWHIECSAMSVSSLNMPFDIHTGGIDLIFPHHENEIAQSTATQGDKLANYFVHNEHMLIDGHKMSKSLNNFYTLADIESKNIQKMALRMLVLQAHYRTQAHFSWENLSSAENRLKSYRAMADLRWQPTSSNSKITAEQIEATYNSMLESAKEDLDTPNALATLSQFEKEVSAAGIPSQSVESFKDFIVKVDKLLGLNISTDDINQKAKDLIAERLSARSNGDYKKSDELRRQLEEQGIGVRDLAETTLWYHL